MVGRLSPTKKIVFSAIIALILLGIVELAASVAGTIVTGRRFSRERLQEHRDALIAHAGRVAVNPKARWVHEEILHPYVGYTPVPRGPGAPAGVAGPVAAAPPVRAPDRVTVAFVGGSFAVAFADHGAARLLARLSELPAFRGRTLVPLNLAVGGYKQPQQLMSIAYLQSVGAELDLLVNIDGFNDITLHPTEGALAHVSPAYPRRWQRRIDGVLHGGTLRLMVLRVQLEQKRAALAQAFSITPWRHLNVVNLVYVVLDRDLERRVEVADHELLGRERAEGASTPAEGASTPAKGPDLAFTTEAEMLAYLTGLWQRSSRLMDRLARSGGTRYYHFLQPNQYVPESKPMGPEERAAAWAVKSPYARLVPAGYPMLRRAGRELQAEGVRFVDLTDAFAVHPEALYIDACCHISEHGNLILADLIFDAIRRDLEAPAAAVTR